MPGLISDFLISLDDRYLYFVNWFHGDVRQYSIEDPSKPVLTGQVWVGGLLHKGSDVVYVSEDGAESQFSVPVIKVSYLLSVSIYILVSYLTFLPLFCKQHVFILNY